MRVELMRTYPVPRKKAYDYLDDFKTWPAWYAGMLEIIEPEASAWSSPGDKVRFAYKLLGRRMEGECTLEEVRESELVSFTATIPMVGDVHQEWLYRDAGEGAFILDAGEGAFILKVRRPSPPVGSAGSSTRWSSRACWSAICAKPWTTWRRPSRWESRGDLQLILGRRARHQARALRRSRVVAPSLRRHRATDACA